MVRGEQLACEYQNTSWRNSLPAAMQKDNGINIADDFNVNVYV